jgi:thioredoxin reductase (NADPH)
MEAEVTIIGAGPAGIQAGIHASRKKVSVVVVGKIENSAAYEAHIENHFGAKGKADGADLLKDGISKAAGFGCVILNENVVSASKKGNGFLIVTESGTEIISKTVILASGVSRNKLGVPGEKELFGKGVSYCAACDCGFYKGKTVVIVGDESEAAASAELMTKYASKTYWVIGDAKVSKEMVDKAKASGTEIVKGRVRSIDGAPKVGSVTLEDGRVLTADGVFIELGGRSSADLAMDLDVMPNTDGTVTVDRNCRTSVPGVFACGDITGKPWQVAKAVGEGAVAGTYAADKVKENADR